jgi:hypothetical protein
LGLSIDGWGRPSVPPSLLATAVVLQTYERASDEEATQRAAGDLRRKVALGLEVDARPFANSSARSSSSTRTSGCCSRRAWRRPSGGGSSARTGD